MNSLVPTRVSELTDAFSEYIHVIAYVCIVCYIRNRERVRKVYGRFAPFDVSPPTVVVSPPSVDFSPLLVSCNFRNVLLR